MSEITKARLKEQVGELVAHLKRENPELLRTVEAFQRLDKVAYKLGLLEETESYATQVSWWPLVSVLGTFSSGKSTFINTLLGRRVQSTGNQAVDDKFTVICYGREDTPRVLPSLALDSDPRFSFYGISKKIDEAMEGEGQRLDSYLQLKTCNSEYLRGKIIIDSPGFDADAQRTSTLRITNHVIDLSDLVLIFFDARHPEPGAMRDTLEHLVSDVHERDDFNKFLHILNQIDNAAREDNPEELFAAWQRALAQKGLTSGRFYSIYDPTAAPPIEDENLRRRFEAKSREHNQEILRRINQLEVDRAYRVAGRLEQLAKQIRDQVVPRLVAARRSWRRRLLWLDGIVFGAIIGSALVASFRLGYWQGVNFQPPWLTFVLERPVLLWGGVVVIVVALAQLHRWMRKVAARAVVKRIRADDSLGDQAESIADAFARNARSWRPFIFLKPRGWGFRSVRKLDSILDDAHRIVQEFNDHYADPSGVEAPVPSPKPTEIREIEPEQEPQEPQEPQAQQKPRDDRGPLATAAQ